MKMYKWKGKSYCDCLFFFYLDFTGIDCQAFKGTTGFKHEGHKIVKSQWYSPIYFYAP